MDIKIRNLDETVVVWIEQEARKAKVSREEFLRRLLANLSLAPEIKDYNEQLQSFINQSLTVNQEVIKKNTELLERIETTLILLSSK